ncbi:hypothetical protein POM88_013623 [Heracleum sosnowskyi]|uniref:Uncharacterized protein n=1 Tax=Heracleum sosnowskyi TaxID=360622 RepID=A0AAD8IYU0_9APIA|nr:hypothetical protein POM88_013623 [Heracleum sosnowskyi]
MQTLNKSDAYTLKNMYLKLGANGNGTPSTMTMPGQAGGTTSSTSRTNPLPGTASTMTMPGQVGGTSTSTSRTSPLPGPETPRKRNNIDKRKQAFGKVIKLFFCTRVAGLALTAVPLLQLPTMHVGGGPKGYSICCGKGKVQLPLLRETPPELLRLLTGGGREGQMFQREIRTYNNIFAFVSFGRDVDNSVNSGRGPFVFRIRGYTYHSIGSLFPPPGCTPKFAQIYMYDAQEALQYRLQFPGRENALTAATISSLSEMRERENTLVDIFKQIRERFRDVEQDSLAVCREYGHPDLFITFTCNPKWEEIKYAVELCGSSDASVRPDIISRVFKLKLDAMMSDLTKHDVLGRVLAAVYTVEFQKRDKDVPPVTIDGRKISFSAWVLGLGNGSERTTPLDDENDPSWVRIPDEVHVKYTGDPVDVMVDEIYAELHLKYKDVEYLRDRAILTPLNENVGIINKKVLDRLPGESKIYKSCDTICKGSSTSDSTECRNQLQTFSALSFGLQEETIKVRVIRLWNGMSYRTSDEAAIYFILLDEEDNQTLALSQLTGRARFVAELHEGLVYYITNFKIVAGPPKWNPVIAGKVILLHTQTKAWPCYDSCSIARMKFVLSPFPTIAARLEDMTAFKSSKTIILAADTTGTAKLVIKTRELEQLAGLPLLQLITQCADKHVKHEIPLPHLKCIADVTGMVTDYGNPERASNGALKQDIVLANERGKKMTVTLWEEMAEQFQAALNETRGVPVFAVICGLLTKKFADNVTLSSTDATKSYLNIDYKPLARCLCHAEIVAIVDGEGWYYTCCPKCARKVRLLGQGYYFGSCAENVSDPKQRYKLIVRVVDISGTTTFTLFNKEVERLVVVPVENILAELTQDNPATEIPAVLKNVIGKTCGFDVKISSYNTNLCYEEYTVVKLSEYEPTEVEDVAEPSGAGVEAQNTT